jgi:MFS family permease
MTVTQARPSRTARLASAWRSGPLSVPGFRLLTIGQFTSTAGDYCYAVALPWLVLSGGGSAAGNDVAPEEATAEASAAASAEPAPVSVWALLRQSRVLQIILVVVLSANFALVGTTEVALPALAHARFGADGYGAVLTCVAAAALVGALVVGKLGDRFRPVTLIAGSLLAGGAAIAAAPFIGGLPGIAAGMAVFGIATGFDNVVSITLIQRWAPPAMLGRVWGLLMLASVGSFPVATFVAGLLVRHLGPTAIFPISGALLALTMAYGLTQREFRDFGTADKDTGDKETGDKEMLSADKRLSQADA